MATVFLTWCLGGGLNNSYILFGGATVGANINLANLKASQGIVIDSSNVGGTAIVSGAGDVNADGYDDVLVGAQNADGSGTDSGSAFVLFGNNGGAGTASKTLTGTAGINKMIGGAGNDTFNSVGTGDVVRGGAGKDTIKLSQTTFADIDGGGGDEDTLVLGVDVLNFDLGTFGEKLANVERISLDADVVQTVTIDRYDVVRVSDFSSAFNKSFIIYGDETGALKDKVNLGPSANGGVWQDEGDVSLKIDFIQSNVKFDIWNNGAVNVLIEQGIAVSLL